MFGVLERNPGFRRLWLSQAVSQAGDWLSRMAVLELIAELAGGTHAVGVGALYAGEVATRLLPTSVMGSLAGPIADRLPRRALMITADLLRAGVVLCLLLIRSAEDLPLLYGLVVLQMGTSIFFDAARSASVPNLVSRDELHEAATLSALTWSAMLSFGALLGGQLVGLIGREGVFVTDAASYLVSAALLFGLRLPPAPRHAAPLRLRDVLLFTEMRAGVAHARAVRIAPAVLAKSLWGGAGGFLVMLSVAGKERFAGPGAPGEVAAVIGLLYGARGLGTGLGPILARRWLGSGEDRLRLQITLGFLVGAAGYGAFAVTESLLPALGWVFLAHCGGSTIWVASTALWQRHVADRFRGRVFALEFLGMTFAFSLGGLLTGFVYDLRESVAAATWSACALVLAGAFVWSRLARRMDLETEVEP